MKSLATLHNLYTSLSLNSTSTNALLGVQLMSDQQRYLIQKYFDNERTYTTTTIGAMSLAVTAVINSSALSATLTGTWNYPTGTQNVTFTNASGTAYATTTTLASAAVSGTLSAVWTGPTGLQKITFTNTASDSRDVSFTNGSATISWTIPLTSATTSTTITTGSTSQIIPVLFTNGSTSISWITPLTYGISTLTITTQGFQKYLIPANMSKITSDFITVGQLRFTPAPVETREEWDRLNTLPYVSDIVNYYFIYNGYLEFFPIPSTTGNIITFNYKARLPDFSIAFLFSDASGAAFSAGSKAFDYQKGTIATATIGSTSITGTSTAWNTTGKFPLNVDLTFYNLYLQINSPYGDDQWYQIQQFTSDTALTLKSPIQNIPNVTSATYSIAQLPVLSADFHDMIVHGALMTYFSAIVPDGGRYKQFEALFGQRLELLKDYAGTKSINVDLGSTPAYQNPNLFTYVSP